MKTQFTFVFPDYLTMFVPLTALLGDVEDSFWFPKQASTFAENVDWTFDLILYISTVFFVGIVFAIVWFSIRYRKKKGEKAESQITHHTGLELTWSIGPCFLMAWMFVQGALSFLDMRTPPDGAYELNVQAQKWSWSIDYGGGVFHPELHLVVNEPVKLTMRSSDVIHSLFVPAFRAKKDIVPGRYNYMWFEPTIVTEKVSDEVLATALAEKGGSVWTFEDTEHYQFTSEGYTFYDLYCAEYCGEDHSVMQTVVVVHETQDELDQWIKANSTRGGIPPATWGEQLYTRRGCSGCHSLDGTKRTGPSFQNSFGNLNRQLADGSTVEFEANYVRESILDPKAKVADGFKPVMPSFKGQLSDDDIDSIVAYLKTLSNNE